MHKLKKFSTFLSHARVSCKLSPTITSSLFKSELPQQALTLTEAPKSFFASSSDYHNFHNHPSHNNRDDFNAPNDQSQNTNSMFVSKYFQIPDEEIYKFLDANNLEFKVRPTGQVVLKYCPFCEKPHHNKLDNFWTLNLKPKSGSFICFRCKGTGSWFTFKNRLLNNGRNLDFHIQSNSSMLPPVQSSHSRSSIKPQGPQLASSSLTYLRLQSLVMAEFPEINQYLTGAGEGRQISMDTLIKYRVGVGYESFLDESGEVTELPCVYFPMFAYKSDESLKLDRKAPEKMSEENTGSKENLHSLENLLAQEIIPGAETVKSINDSTHVLVRNKIRAIYKKNKGFQRMEPAPGYWGLFGLSTIPEDAKAVVLTEGEYDAMAVYEATKMPAISLPNGANHLPLQILPYLERFEKIYLWMDADQVGQANAANFAQKLGIGRVYLVNGRRYDFEGPKDANDALRKDPASIRQYLDEARCLTQENITTYSELKAKIEGNIFGYEKSTGLKSHFFQWYNKKLKGFRRGEMTIITGPTGSGKTSVLSQLSLDFAKQGVGTLWGSFEIKNDTLLTNMLLQYSGVNLFKEPKKFEYHSQNFEQLPLYFLKFFGSNDIDKIIQTVEYAIYSFDIGHVIIDNLQFLLSGQAKGFEKFDLQDVAISKLRDLATSKNVHVTVVIHPKKVDDTQELTINSVFGSAKATQEADNIIILQTKPKYKVIDIKKNRFDGDLGKVPVGFDRDTKRFFELKEAEVFTLHRTTDTVKEIIETRKSKNMLDNLSEEIHQPYVPPPKVEVAKETPKQASLSQKTPEQAAPSQPTPKQAPQQAAPSPVQNTEKKVEVAPPVEVKASKIEEFENEDEVEIIKLEEEPELAQQMEDQFYEFDNSTEKYSAEELLESELERNTELAKDQPLVVEKELSSDEEGKQQLKNLIMEKEIHENISKMDANVQAPEAVQTQSEDIKVEVMEESVQAEEKIVESAPVEVQKEEELNKKEERSEVAAPAKAQKKKKKEGGLYGMMYEAQDKQVTLKDSFYTEEDRRTVRENLESIETEKKRKYQDMKRRRQKSLEEQLMEAEIAEANKNSKK